MQLHADWAVTMGCGDVCPYVPIRSHILTLAHKQTRDCLRQDVCALL